MYKDLKNLPFYNNSPNPYKKTPIDPFYNGNKTSIAPEERYGFKPVSESFEDEFNLKEDFKSSESFDYGFKSSEDKEYDYKPRQKPVKTKSAILNDYDDDHFYKHEEECETCDYIELFQNIDRQKFCEMFVFSEIIGKPKALKEK